QCELSDEEKVIHGAIIFRCFNCGNVEPPSPAISKDSVETSASLVHSLANATATLALALTKVVCAVKILLDFDDSGRDLYVDTATSAVPHLCFEFHPFLNIVISEVKASSQD